MEKLTNLIKEWQDKYDDAKNKYNKVIDVIKDNREAYNGTRPIKTPDGRDAAKQTSNVRKVCFELIEAQVDSNIPLPKVVSKEGYEDQAMTIEMFLKNEIDRLPMEQINDLQNRLTLIDGGSVFYLEWDNTKGTRTTSGELSIKSLDSTQVIPQPGVYDVEDMDYIFLDFEQTRAKIKEKYDVSVEEDGDSSINEDLLVHHYCFYKDKDGDICLYSWVGDTEIQNLPKYFARHKKVCKKCGKDKEFGKETCECGSKKFEETKKDTETLMIPTEQIDPITGQPSMVDVPVEVPYYVPKFFPIVIRKNVSKLDSFLGISDIEFIKDQQNDLNIYSAKIREKLLKGGSIVLKPETVKFKANDDELKIVDIKNINQMGMFDVRTIQADISKDLNMLETNYMIARQTIGITDSYQGRQDPTATSGRAKEIAAAQSAGRLVSKREMKNSAFSKVYEYAFKLLLAFADEPRNYADIDTKGQMMYKIFDKKDFLLRDSAGEYYYNDNFMFSTDVSSTLSNNREAMWQETRMNFTSGAYGNPQDLGTLVMFWNMMNTLHYPGAKQALAYLEERKMEQEMIRQQEMITKNIQETNVERLMTDNKMKQLDYENTINQLRQHQQQGGM